jgi:hypothetical protein
MPGMRGSNLRSFYLLISKSTAFDLHFYKGLNELLPGVMKKIKLKLKKTIGSYINTKEREERK